MAGTAATQFPAFLLSRGKRTCLSVSRTGAVPAKRIRSTAWTRPTRPIGRRTGARVRTDGEPRAHGTVPPGNPFLSSCLCLVPRRCERKLSVTCPVLPASLVVGHLLHLAPSTSRLIIPRVRARTGNGYRYRLPPLPSFVAALRPGFLLPLRHFQRPDQNQNQTRQRKRNPNLRRRRGEKLGDLGGLNCSGFARVRWESGPGSGE